MEYDVVDKAEQAIKNLNKDRFGNVALSTSQIRKFLTAVNAVKNKVDSEQIKATDKNILSADLVAEVKFLKVNILYQAGREKAANRGHEKEINDFVKKTEIAQVIMDIGNDAKKFNKFCKYVEALVAFHKFYGGRD